MDRILPILRTRKEEISAGRMDPKRDVMSCLLALSDENEEPINEGTIIDTTVTLVIASHNNDGNSFEPDDLEASERS
ncbi:hypothetical protein NL676_002578 [Syzygium grande]|nr:hypothetical protein NL676_002578 [Syzygium grande]